MMKFWNTAPVGFLDDPITGLSEEKFAGISETMLRLDAI